MNTMAKYLEQNIISFVQTLIYKYKKLGLNETETIILCQLYSFHKLNNKDIPIKELSNNMTLSENDLSMYIISLIERGYINISLVDNHEEYDLNGTFERLGKLLQEEDNKSNTPSKKEQIAIVCEYLESMTSRISNANDLVFINRWLDEGRTIEEIKEGILSSVKLNKTSINYIDAVISSKKKRVNENIEIDEELKGILDDINVKRR